MVETPRKLLRTHSYRVRRNTILVKSQNPRYFFPTTFLHLARPLYTPVCFAQIWIHNVIHSTAERGFLVTNNSPPFHDYRIPMFIPSRFAQQPAVSFLSSPIPRCSFSIIVELGVHHPPIARQMRDALHELTP